MKTIRVLGNCIFLKDDLVERIKENASTVVDYQVMPYHNCSSEIIDVSGYSDCSIFVLDSITDNGCIAIAIDKNGKPRQKYLLLPVPEP